MRRFIDVLKAVCSISAAIVIYITVIKATEGGVDILPYVLASVFAASFTASLFCISRLSDRLSSLEARSGKEETGETEEPVEPEEVYSEEEVHGADEGAEYFATEDPDYTGTDFSEEETDDEGEDTKDIYGD